MPSTRPRKSGTAKSAKPTAAPPVDEPVQSAPPEPAAGDADDREAMIRIAAYARYERRGGVSGHELEDWLEAEIEVDRRLGGEREPGGA
jgi:hypothetical protein